MSKFFNKVEDLSNKVMLNPVIKTADTSRKLLRDLKKKISNRNNSIKKWNKRYYKSNWVFRK